MPNLKKFIKDLRQELFDPHKFITNYLNTDFPVIPQSAPTKG